MQRMAQQLGLAPLDLRVYLGETTITMRELLNLQPGDVIPTEKSAEADCILRIVGQNKFAGQMGQVNAKRALKITRRAALEEPL